MKPAKHLDVSITYVKGKVFDVELYEPESGDTTKIRIDLASTQQMEPKEAVWREVCFWAYSMIDHEDE